MRHCRTLKMRAGHGIIGDANCASSSPRQVLIASKRTYDELGLAPGVLRENLLVDGDVEEFQSGQVVRVGGSVLVRLTFRCEPCVKLNRARPGLAREVVGRRGFLGRVISGGEVQAGDEITLTDSVFFPMPDQPRARVYDLISRIPSGRTLGFKPLVATVGLPKTYVRVLPRFLTAAPTAIPVHRVITTDCELIPQHLPHQANRLMEEGVALTDAGRVASHHLWDSAEYFGVEGMLHALEC
jgi:alkylated DNA nucleotide flippase Atl1